MATSKEKKHPCPDCKMCQWCSERRCEMCRGWLVKQADNCNDNSFCTSECNGKCKS